MLASTSIDSEDEGRAASRQGVDAAVDVEGEATANADEGAAHVPPPAPDPPPASAPEPTQSRPPYRLALYVREGEEASHPAGWQKQLERSQFVGRAIVAAVGLEELLDQQHPWPVGEDESSESSESESQSSESEGSELDEQVEMAAVKYKYAARRVQKACPGWAFVGINRLGEGAAMTSDLACVENSMPCECGGGCTGLWPWQLQPESHGFCPCIRDERIHWVRESQGRRAVFDAFPGVIGVKDDPA